MALDPYADATYPATVMTPRSVDNLPNMTFDSEKPKVLFAEDIARLNNEAVSIETVLGANPQGGHATVAARIAAVEEIIGTIMGRVYPVGSQYVNFTDSTNPATLLGVGTWVLAAKGRVVFGKADSGTFATAGATGGEETHTLTVAEMPAHRHNFIQRPRWWGDDVLAGDSGSVYSQTATTQQFAHSSEARELQNTGGGQAHNNLPPYTVAYVWRRTA